MHPARIKWELNVGYMGLDGSKRDNTRPHNVAEGLGGVQVSADVRGSGQKRLADRSQHNGLPLISRTA